MMNQDLKPVVQGLKNSSNSPMAARKYQIVGASQQKSHSTLRHFVAGSIAAPAFNTSQTSLSRINSNKFNLRDSSQTDIKIKNMFIHKAALQGRKSPDHNLLPMEFDNRYTAAAGGNAASTAAVDGLKAAPSGGNIGRPAAIAPVGIHGAL